MSRGRDKADATKSETVCSAPKDLVEGRANRLIGENIATAPTITHGYPSLFDISEESKV
jgi:hypothetical protein